MIPARLCANPNFRREFIPRSGQTCCCHRCAAEFRRIKAGKISDQPVKPCLLQEVWR